MEKNQKDELVGEDTTDQYWNEELAEEDTLPKSNPYCSCLAPG